MNPHRLASLALVVLVGFAGCAGTPGAPTTTATGTASETPEATPTRTATQTSGPTADPPSTADCPALVSVDPVDDVPADATVLPYENLSAERRAEFETALSEGHAEIEGGGEGYRFWVDRPYVRYDGTVYRAVVAVC